MVNNARRSAADSEPAIRGTLSAADLATLESIEQRLLWLSTQSIHHSHKSNEINFDVVINS